MKTHSFHLISEMFTIYLPVYIARKLALNLCYYCSTVYLYIFLKQYYGYFYWPLILHFSSIIADKVFNP